MSKRNSKAEAPGTPPLASDPSAVGTAEIETVATVDGEGLEEQENEPQPPSFPPYPPYVPEPAPLCVADVVDHGNEMRREHKSKPKQRVKPYPRPAKPWGCAAGSAPMTRRQLLAHLKCLKRHGVVLTDRLTQIAKPSRRTVLSKWRENAEILAPEIIVRYRTLLDADDPWSSDQAYQFFLNMRRTRRKTPCQQKKLSKREMQAICGDKRFTWARNATVAFARGIQERLCKPGCFTLNGGMLRLSDIILEELCGYMSVRVPARCSNSREARFMMEMSDKIAIWIDDILAESDDRMLMMDFDEDDDMLLLASDSSGGGDFADSFLNMMGDSFGGDMLEAFKILNMAMDKKGTARLLSHGKFNQTYKEGAEALRQARDFHATEFDCTLAQILNVDLTNCASKDTPRKLKPAMKEMVDICAKYLAQNAEYQKDKGEAFQLLLEAMYSRGPCLLYSQGKSRRTYAQAADDLVSAKSLEIDSDDPVLTEVISTALSTLVEPKTSDYLLAEMLETLDMCSRYLSKKAIDEDERGPAFDHLIKSLEKHGNMPFTPEYPPLALRFAAAYVLQSAPALRPRAPAPATAVTPTSIHSMERPKTPPLGSATGVPVQASTHEQPTLKIVPVQTSKDPLPPEVTTSLKSTKSPVPTTGSVKTMLAPDGGGSLKTMIRPQEMGQASKPPSATVQPVGSIKSAKSQQEAVKPVGSARSAKSAVADAKSSHLIATMGPVPESAEIFSEALHHAVDSETPLHMAKEMNELVDRCSGYLAGFVRDRDLTIRLLLQMMYGRKAVGLVERKRKKITYGEGATEIQQAPFLIPFLPVKDIAVEIKNKLTEDMKDITPYELKVSMQTAIKDASGYLSQLMGVKSGVAGSSRYNLEFLIAVKQTLGTRPLYKYKAYGHTYAECAKTLKFAGPLERGDAAPDLHAEIKGEMHLGMPLRIAPTVVKDLKDTIHDASKHLAYYGKQKGLAMEHLVQSMKEKGAGDFVYIQGLPETYESGARAIEQSPTLHNDSVDRPTYDMARQKLTQLTKDKPHPELEPHMPGIVDEASRFLAKQLPQTHADKRAMLARLLAMKGDKILAHDGLYKMTFKIGSQDLANAKFGKTTAANEKLRDEILDHMKSVISEPKTTLLLQEVISEGAAYLADTISGRALALKAIHDALVSQGNKPFLTVGRFTRTHQEVADIIKTAPYFSDKANPSLYGVVSDKIKNLQKANLGALAETHMGDTTNQVSKHIAHVAADEAGLSASQLAAWSASGGESNKSFNGLFLKCPLGKDGSLLSKVGSAFGIKKIPSRDGRGGPGRPGDGPGGAGSGTGGQGGAGAAGSGIGAQGPGSPDGGKPESPGAKGGPGSPGYQGPGSHGYQGGPGTPAYQGGTGGGGILGPSGQVGIPGSPGYQGPGSPEFQGVPGSPGYQGPGSPGFQGGTGSAGFLGGPVSAGFQGRPGSPDYQGPGSPGFQGGPGSAGFQGRPGSAGFQGGPGRAAFEGPGSSAFQGGPGGSDIRGQSDQGGIPGSPGYQGGPGSPGYQGGPGSQGYKGGPGSPGGPGSGIGGPGNGIGGLGGPGSPSGPGGPGSKIGGLSGLVSGLIGRDKSGAGGEGASLRAGSAAGRGSPKSAGDLKAEIEENERAQQLLIRKLSSKGGQVFYEQPLTSLTHSKAASWLQMEEPPLPIDKSVKHSSDSARLSKKFERKLSILVSAPGSSPDLIKEPMQDVIIESSRVLSEYFVATNYMRLVRDALITEMQKKGNEILIEVDGAAETYFFAAQRLKKAKSYEVKEPCTKMFYYISKKLEEMIRCRQMPRKLMGTMKEHAKVASDYLSAQVTKPDVWIEAYVSILDEMENTGSKLLFRDQIPKSYKDCATYLRGLPSYEDQIRKCDLFLNSAIPLKLMMMMRDADKKNDSVCNVITKVTKLLVSYIRLQKELTEVLKYLVTLLDRAKCGVILNHGELRKTYRDAANLLRNKNTDQINQITRMIDPVVARKVQIKMDNLVKDVWIPAALKEHLQDALEITTNYLAVELLEPHTIRVCKCMNSVFVQCELWCDEILRKITRPICSCARHTAAQMTECHGHGRPMKPSERAARPLVPDPCPLIFKDCPATKCSEGMDEQNPCPAIMNATTYLMYSASYDYLPTLGTVEPLPENDMTPFGSNESLMPEDSMALGPHSKNTVLCARLEAEQGPPRAWWSAPKVQTSDSSFYSARTSCNSSATPTHSPVPTSASTSGLTSCPVSGVVSTDQMADWHALMVSFVWNIQAWRDWLQETMDRGLQHRSMPAAKEEEHWLAFRNRVTTETVQWRHYNVFSRELLVRIALRYQDKVIISPTSAAERTREFLFSQEEMLQIIEIFNRWTRWMAKTVNKTDALNIPPNNKELMSDRRWNYFKEKVEGCSKEWLKYNEHLKTCWQDKYWASIADWLPPRQQAGPLWVVSACGAVPSGAVAAGVHDGQVCWVTRTTHRNRVLPAALLPAKHCCWLYADGKIHYYTKYQVMCNAEVAWVPWRAGSMRSAAIRVATDIYIGRVLYRGNHLVGAVQPPTYRCHVVIFSRPFAFSCFELLVVAPASTKAGSSNAASKSA